MLRLALQSLRHYRRTNLGVLCGIILAAAVLTGALLVGDSVDYSLETFALQRLGDIELAMDTRNEFVSQQLAMRLAEKSDHAVTPALRLRGMAIRQGLTQGDRAQVNKVDVHGITPAFWAFGEGDPFTLAPGETALNTKLADALDVGVGDDVSLRVLKPSLMARDSPLSWRSDDRSRRARFTVAHIVPDAAMGRFGLSPSQNAPYNAFIDLAELQDLIDLQDRANLILAAGDAIVTKAALDSAWKPRDIGLDFRAHPSGVVQLESDRVFIDEETARAALDIPGAQGVLTYLATTLEVGERRTPYFFAVAGPVPDGMPDDQVVINRWMADELNVTPGEEVTMTYSVVLPNNEFEERARNFTIHSIRAMDQLTTERALMPTFPGLSDVESCADWDIGMPMDDELLNDEANEAYWDAYRETPKAFVTLAAGQAMWGNRFGALTAVRFNAGAGDIERLRMQLRNAMDPDKAGLVFIPVREQADAAVAQALDFGGLFLGMSFFLIVAALVLTGLLFIFGAQQRASQIGALLAVGFQTRTVRRLLMAEAAIIALVGCAIGSALGILYTRTLIFALATYWQGAIADARILFHATPTTIAIGAIATLVCALLSMYIAIQRLSRRTARDLLHMDLAQDDIAANKQSRPSRTLPTILFIAACVIVAFPLFSGPASLAPAFFGAGALLLLSGMAYFRWLLRARLADADAEAFSPQRLALLNLARRSGRSVAVAGLLGCGCYLVFAVSAMQQDFAATADQRSSGTGGFALVADATFALQEDPVTRFREGGVSAVAIKVRDGDDASCLNLNRAQTPRLLGVDVDELITRGAFSAGDAEALWNLLRTPLPNGEIPALAGDSNTAMFNLQMPTGIENGAVLVYQDEDGEDAPIKLVGQLPMRLSVFQGSILIARENFTRLFPAEDGHRMFLIDTPAGQAHEVASQLSRRFDRYGLDAIPPVQRLREFYTVEATYLAIFLVLGGLGVAVGGMGMGIVILRNLFERRAELAMLRALGFRRDQVLRVLLAEHGYLLLAGLGIGGVAAGVSMLPAWIAANGNSNWGMQLTVALAIVLSYTGCMIAAVRIGSRASDVQDLRSE